MLLRRKLPYLLLCAPMIAAGCFGGSIEDDTGETQGDGDPGDGDPGDGDPTGDGDPGDGDPTGDGDPGDGDPGDGDGDPNMCTPEETACGDACVVLSEDPAHCGACDHDCLGGMCLDGTCEPVELASGKGRLFMVHVDLDNIYYGGDGVDVGRIGKDGSGDTVLIPAGDVQSSEWCYDSAFTGDAVVWGNDWVQPGVRGCSTPDCSGGVQTFFGGTNLLAMAYDANNGELYWTQGPDLVKAAWPNGNQTLVSAGQNPRDITTDGDFVYWIAREAVDDLHIRKLPVGGGPLVELAINRMQGNGLAVGGGKIFWAENVGIVEAALPNGIGGADPLVFADVNEVRRIISDSNYLYWTSNQDGVGTVARCPHDGCNGPPEILAQVPQPWGIALDPVAVYFVTEAGSIYKVAK